MFASQDIRGRFQSLGQFVMQRQPRDRSDARAVDESTDAYDTIDWLLKNVPGNNGRAGMYGVSPEHLVPSVRPQSADMGGNIFNARASDYQKATQRLYRSKAFALILRLARPPFDKEPS